MPQGLQCFDANGYLLLDITDRLSRELGVFNSGTSAGSFTDDNLLTGIPWYYIFPPINKDIFYMQMPTVTISGNKVSWVFDAPTWSISKGNLDCYIIYGVY